MITKLTVPSVQAEVHLAADEYFEVEVHSTRKFMVQKIYFFRYLSSISGIRITFEGQRILKDGSLGAPVKENYFTERAALKLVPSALFNALEEQFLIYDKAQARVIEALDA